jgi:hypothetical protein
MNKIQRPIYALAVSILIMAVCGTAASQLRTFVSTNGSDTNPCSVAAPCRSFQQAHDTVASGGEVVALNSGGYGPVTINKSVTIGGDGVHAAISVGTGAVGVTIGTPNITVTLRSLAVLGGGTGVNGISVTATGVTLHVENCIVDGFNSGAGLSFSGGGSLFVSDTIARNGVNSAIGISISSSNAVLAKINRCAMTNNSSNGLFVSGASLKVEVRDSTVTSSGFSGINLFNGTVALDNVLSALNLGSGVIVQGGLLRIANSTLIDNGAFGLLNTSGTVRSTGNNRVDGNAALQVSGSIGTYAQF